MHAADGDPHVRASKLANALFERGSAHQRFVDRVPDVLEAITQTAVSLECEAAYDDAAARTVDTAIAALLKQQHRAEHRAAAINALAGDVAQMHQGELDAHNLDWDAQIARFLQQASERAADADAEKDRAALRDIRERVWEVTHPGEPMRDVHEGGDADDASDGADDADELQVSGGTFTSTCPILQTPMVDAVRNSMCKHVYSRQGAMQLIEQATGAATCPHVGCHAALLAANLRKDIPTIDRVRRELRRQAQRRAGAHGGGGDGGGYDDDDDGGGGGLLDFTQADEDGVDA